MDLKRICFALLLNLILKTKQGEHKLEFIIAMPGAGLLLHAWGLQRGYPLWTCFLQFLNKSLIRKSPVLEWDHFFWNLGFCESKGKAALKRICFT